MNKLSVVDCFVFRLGSFWEKLSECTVRCTLPCRRTFNISVRGYPYVSCSVVCDLSTSQYSFPLLHIVCCNPVYVCTKVRYVLEQCTSMLLLLEKITHVFVSYHGSSAKS